jgi:hypothetical protein
MTTLRYRNARDEADLLGQVFTPQPIAELLVKSLPADQRPVRQIVDLGAGEGALSLSALARYKRAKALLVEIDPRYAKSLCGLIKSGMNAVQVAHADVLSANWTIPINPDLILSNPPYGAIAVTPEIKNVLVRSGLDVPVSGEWVRGDAAFVARAWAIAERGSRLGLIVASPMIREPACRRLRETLVSELRGLCVTQLDERTFQNAEVRAFLITGQRSINRHRNVLLRKVLADGTIFDEMEVSHTAAVLNLDIDYHRALGRLGLTANDVSETLGSVGASIVRGSRSQKDFERLGLSAFHTTDFPDSADGVVLRGARSGYHLAKSGDILIPRVGSRCLAKQARVREGEGLFTDCIYRLTVKQRSLARVWKTLASSFGAEWRLANAGGSCAKHITVQTLLAMPVIS